MSNASFKRNFARLLEKAGDKADEVVRKCAADIANSLIMKSPVDTGRFRANWALGFDVADTAISNDTDKTGMVTAGKLATELRGYKTGQTIHVTNSLPYATRLEFDSWSNQAPQGMVRVTVEEFNQFMRRAVAGAKSE